MCLLKVLKFLNSCFTIKSYFIYSFLLTCVGLRIAKAGLILSSEEKHENSAPTPELARLNGYRCDIHTVRTKDGYLLQVHRLPGGRASPINCSLPPVLLMHGIFLSSATWLIPGPAQGLGYLLADQGYDVWLGSIRGDVYGRNNVYFNVDEDPFWDFSWEKVGLYDVPTTIDYILETTGYEQLLFVRHSMATTEFFVLCTLRPEYNNKVQHMVGLGPIAYLTYSPSAFQLLSPIGDLLALILSLPMHGELLPRNSEVTNLLQYACAIPANAVICENILFSIYEGIDIIGFNQTLLPIIFGHEPAGASVDTLLHFFQVVNSKRFQRFDYGPEKNLEVYNSTTPPEFNLSEISVPMSFFYGDNDLIADRKSNVGVTYTTFHAGLRGCRFLITDKTANLCPESTPFIKQKICYSDILKLVSQLKVQVDVYRVNMTSFNHIDYVYGKNVKTLVNDKVISILMAKQTLTRRTVCGP